MIRLLSSAALLLFALLPSLSAQSFLIVAGLGANKTVVSNGSALTVAADGIGSASTVTFTFTYLGSATANVSAIQLIGASDFSLVNEPALPLSMSGQQSFSLSVKFTPSSGDRVTTTLLLTVNESSGNVTGSNGTIGLNLAGTAPNLTVAYFLETNQNLISLTPGSTLLFTDVLAGTTALADVVVANTGSATGTVQSISLEGSAFQLLGVPLLPGSLGSSQSFQFTIRYSPTQNGTATGKLKLGINGTTVEIGLQANAVGPIYTYQLIENEVASDLSPSQPFVLTKTGIGDVRTFVVVVKNTGDADGTISAINLLGPGFQLTDAPFLPTTLVPGGSLFFGFQFAPVQSGKAIGRMRVGNDTFELDAAVGGKLTFSYTADGRTLSIAPNGTITMQPVVAGSKSPLLFQMTNAGTDQATVTSIGLSGAGFSFGQLPAFPLNIDPGSQVTIPITFAPTGIGTATAQLRVDSTLFTITSSGTTPPPLPAVQFEGASGVQQPMQQPSVGLSLAAPYSATLHGVLSMVMEANGTDDSVQFATGGRSVTFTIPANTTNAIFPNNLNLVRLQTGTLAGNITLTATFATAENFDVTPDTPPRVTLTIPPLVPGLLDIQLASSTATSVTLLITGYTTTRDLSTLSLEFTPIANYSFPTSKFSFDLTGPSTVWFQSAGSQGYGGLFSASVVFATSSTLSKTQTLSDILKAASATIANSQGVSQSITLNLH